MVCTFRRSAGSPSFEQTGATVPVQLPPPSPPQMSLHYVLDFNSRAAAHPPSLLPPQLRLPPCQTAGCSNAVQLLQLPTPPPWAPSVAAEKLCSPRHAVTCASLASLHPPATPSSLLCPCGPARPVHCPRGVLSYPVSRPLHSLHFGIPLGPSRAPRPKALPRSVLDWDARTLVALLSGDNPLLAIPPCPRSGYRDPAYPPAKYSPTSPWMC